MKENKSPAVCQVTSKSYHDDTRIQTLHGQCRRVEAAGVDVLDWLEANRHVLQLPDLFYLANNRTLFRRGEKSNGSGRGKKLNVSNGGENLKESEHGET